MKHYYKLIFRALIILPCVIMVTFIHAQNATISGTISDTDLPLIGASIIVAGTTNGSTSDIDGSYSISVSPGTHVLAVSFIGYTESERTVTVSAGEDLTIDFLLTEGLSIDEVYKEAINRLYLNHQFLISFPEALKRCQNKDWVRYALLTEVLIVKASSDKVCGLK